MRKLDPLVGKEPFFAEQVPNTFLMQEFFEFKQVVRAQQVVRF
jgi:hypothetical protein